MSVYLMPSGKVAYVDVSDAQDGSRKSLVTREEYERCCCLCPCKCADWPPAEWPCNGLLETYSVNFSTTVNSPSFDAIEFRFISQNVTASSTQCQWIGEDVDYESRQWNGSAWGSWIAATTDLYLWLDCESTPFRWRIGLRPLNTNNINADKLSGAFPVGTYGPTDTDNVNVYGVASGSVPT